jgi:hypothetical protein
MFSSTYCDLGALCVFFFSGKYNSVTNIFTISLDPELAPESDPPPLQQITLQLGGSGSGFTTLIVANSVYSHVGCHFDSHRQWAGFSGVAGFTKYKKNPKLRY